jgi:hypothetical protein
MPGMNVTPNDRIGVADMQLALQSSGYPLELRVSSVLERSGFMPDTNPACFDPDTRKSLEADIHGYNMLWISKRRSETLWVTVLVECENNSQPVVLFERRSKTSFLNKYDVKLVGVPVRMWTSEGWIEMADFAKLDRYHHYCREGSASQYCSFERKHKGPWMAWHPDEQHGSIQRLLLSAEQSAEAFARGWVSPRRLTEEPVNLTILYPVLVLGGDLYRGRVCGDRVDLVKADRLLLSKSSFRRGNAEPDTYYIDVVTEGHLRKYLVLIMSEAERLARKLRRNGALLRRSVEMVVRELRTMRKTEDRQELIST